MSMVCLVTQLYVPIKRLIVYQYMYVSVKADIIAH